VDGLLQIRLPQIALGLINIFRNFGTGPKRLKLCKYLRLFIIIDRYPPVDTTDLMNAIPDLTAPRQNLMVSFAQFRPEKDQAMQLRVWKKVLPKIPKNSEFWLIGTVRDEDD
jgi:hypothetical protein